MLDTSARTIFDGGHDAFRDTVRRVVAGLDIDRHEREGVVEREAWLEAGRVGLLCPGVPEAYGGPGLDFSYNAIVGEEISYAAAPA